MILPQTCDQVKPSQVWLAARHGSCHSCTRYKKTGGHHQNESTACTYNYICESMREGILVYRVQMCNHMCIIYCEDAATNAHARMAPYVYIYLINRYGSLGRAQCSSLWSHKVAQGCTARLVVPFTSESSVHDARATNSAKLWCIPAYAHLVA